MTSLPRKVEGCWQQEGRKQLPLERGPAQGKPQKKILCEDVWGMMGRRYCEELKLDLTWRVGMTGGCLGVAGKGRGEGCHLKIWIVEE